MRHDDIGPWGAGFVESRPRAVARPPFGLRPRSLRSSPPRGPAHARHHPARPRTGHRIAAARSSPTRTFVISSRARVVRRLDVSSVTRPVTGHRPGLGHRARDGPGPRVVGPTRSETASHARRPAPGPRAALSGLLEPWADSDSARGPQDAQTAGAPRDAPNDSGNPRGSRLAITTHLCSTARRWYDSRPWPPSSAWNPAAAPSIA